MPSRVYVTCNPGHITRAFYTTYMQSAACELSFDMACGSGVADLTHHVHQLYSCVCVMCCKVLNHDWGLFCFCMLLVAEEPNIL